MLKYKNKILPNLTQKNNHNFHCDKYNDKCAVTLEQYPKLQKKPSLILMINKTNRF